MLQMDQAGDRKGEWELPSGPAGDPRGAAASGHGPAASGGRQGSTAAMWRGTGILGKFFTLQCLHVLLCSWWFNVNCFSLEEARGRQAGEVRGRQNCERHTKMMRRSRESGPVTSKDSRATTLLCLSHRVLCCGKAGPGCPSQAPHRTAKDRQHDMPREGENMPLTYGGETHV